MCGIIGYCGPKPVKNVLLEGLKRLEYRGYDSAGMAVVDENGNMNVVKRKGKIADLAGAVPTELDGV